jgi:uncharacterized protein YfaS (alpha-2-macroglobulin family)
LRAGGKALEPAPNRARGSERSWSVARASEAASLALEVPRKGPGRLYLLVSSEGVREKAEAPNGGEGLKLTRRFRKRDGSEWARGQAPLRLAELTFVELTLTNTRSERVQNIALVDRLPAGWEIENPRLGRGEPLPWMDLEKLWKADAMNVRDDRLELFGALGPQESRTVVYAVRAVTAGKFTLPSAEAEAMYDPSLWAREAGGEVRVEGGWGDALL